MYLCLFSTQKGVDKNVFRKCIDLCWCLYMYCKLQYTYVCKNMQILTTNNNSNGIVEKLHAERTLIKAQFQTNKSENFE